MFGRAAVGLLSRADLERKKRMCRGHARINVKYLGQRKASQEGSLSKHHCPGISLVRQASPAKEFTLIASSPLASYVLALLVGRFTILSVSWIYFLPKFK